MGHTPGITTAVWPALASLVDDLLESRNALARAQAAQSRLLADAVDLVLASPPRTSRSRRDDHDLALREVSAELATALRASDRTVQRKMGDAFTLRNDFAATMQAWSDGDIDAGHVSAIVSAGVGLDAEVRARYEVHVLDIARSESAGRLQGIARTIAAQIDPDGTQQRVGEAAERRNVRVYDIGDGMARLLADLPAVLAHAIHDRLTQQARTIDDAPDVSGSDGPRSSSPDEPLRDQRDRDEAIGLDAPATVTTGPAGDSPFRSLDQRRADILCDTLLSGAPLAHGAGIAAIAGHVQITIPAASLAGSTDEPAILSHGEPVDAATARVLAGVAPAWDRVFTDPTCGAVLTVDRYRPSEELKRLLRARDEHCRFPGCRRAVIRCDLDHTHDAALGGATSAANLSHLCRRHHTLKHETAWTVRQLGGGALEWRSPVGHRYRERPPSTVRFVAAADPPPF